MSIHKLTAGSGYDYLTRQVAALDATEKGHTGLASYYTEKGETPGIWVGSGMAGIDGLSAGDVVTAQQMQALFGSGHHPLAHDRRERLHGPDLTDKDYRAITRLGVPYKVYTADVSAYRREVATRLAGLTTADGLPRDWPIPPEKRARVHTEVAREFFRAEHGRDPQDARELAATIAKHSRPRTQAVAGFDLTFSPVKSVSTLWAIADPATAARIERAHQHAVKDALAFIERHALYTRQGTNGVRQVDVQGLVATAFTHRDSRAGDPDLHTHVAVANKVQTVDGAWLAVDGRVLFKATVAASETYNTALERHLHEDLGLRFQERESSDLRKRPIREVVGVNPALNQRWSARRVSIEARRSQLAMDFQRTHARPPTPIESVHLAQQATLETRDPKHEPRSLAQQRAAWREQAREVLGGESGVVAMLTTTLANSTPGSNSQGQGGFVDVDVDTVARAVIAQLEHRRSTWQVWHVRAEAERQIRSSGAPPTAMPRLVDQVVTRALSSTISTSLTRPENDIVEPDVLRRRDGSSVYTVAGAQLFTSTTMLDAERRLVAAAGRTDGQAVSDLNQRARADRLAGHAPTGADAPTVTLADGNLASIGELVITRSNDRRLRTTATDWVKNGDRWRVRGIHDGALRAQHAHNGRLITLPAQYVRDCTELGYATTVHAAQGVSVDTMHGLATGDGSRQQLYTMLTRGQHANHVYLQVVGDGDPHSVIRPEMTCPSTPTDLLEQVLARDDAPRSATTMLAEQADPATLLGRAAQRYVDAIYFAAEDRLGSEKGAALEANADRVVPTITEQPAWPALRAHLILSSAHGADPIAQLRAAAEARDLSTAVDIAAVLDWRLDDSGLRGASQGPLPWVPGVPDSLAEHETWGPYLAQRAALVSGLAATVRDAAVGADTPPWAARGGGRPAIAVLGDVAVWRAATLVEQTDRRPTGRPQSQKAAALWQRDLITRLAGEHAPAAQEWGDQIANCSPACGRDPFAPILAERLAAIARCGIDAPSMLRRAAAMGALPDEHASAALWWRITTHLSPAVAEQIDTDHHLSTPWAPRLPELLGHDRATHVQASPWWPTLVSTIDRAIARGWSVQDLLSEESVPSTEHGDDPCQSLVWRISVAMDPIPDEYRDAYSDHEEDLWDHVPLPDDAAQALPHAPSVHDVACPPTDGHPEAVGTDQDFDGGDVGENVDQRLIMAGLRRDALGPLEVSDAQVNRAAERAMAFANSPVTDDRIGQINTLTLAYYRDQLPGSWAAQHLSDRFGSDLSGDDRFQPGFAPPGWDRLINHLRGMGVGDEEMIAAGVAKRNESTGHVRDHFVNRLVLPIIHRRHGWENFETVPFGGGDIILGFVGRRHPDLTDHDRKGPKYLNSPTTSLFSKGAQLYVPGTDLYENGARPVLVEGPMDAIAVTLATAGTQVGVAPLGTSLTEEQAQQLADLRAHFGAGTASELNSSPVGFEPWLTVATDNDTNLAGQVAAERDYWLLAPHGLDPGHALFPAGLDPADVFTRRGPAALRTALPRPGALADTLLQERLTNLPPDRARIAATRIITARPARHWTDGADRVATRLHLSTTLAQRDLIPAADSWTAHRRNAAKTQIDQVSDVRARMQQATALTPDQRWAGLANELDPRLPHEADWPALAQLLDQAHDEGHNVPAVTRQLIADRPLAEQPAQDLRYRLVATLNLTIDADGPMNTTSRAGAERERYARPPSPDKPVRPWR